MTAVLDASTNAAADDRRPTQPLASWRARAGAFCLDALLGVGVLAVLAPLALTAPQRGWLWWVYITVAAVVVLLVLANRWLLPAVTGWSWAARCSVSGWCDGDGAAAGFGRLLARDARASAGHRGAVRRLAVAAVGLDATAHSPICCCAPRFGGWTRPRATCAA